MNRTRTWLLLTTVLVIATAGIVYELISATAASYLLGDTVTQFSIVMGVYLSALGFGALLSRFIVEANVARAFVEVELATAVAGGASAPVLFLAFARTGAFPFVLYGTVALVGTLVGLELPLLIRLLRGHVDFKDLIARALTFDYVGALVGSILFSLVLVPRLGLVRTSLVFGLLNALVGIGSTWILADDAKDGWARTMRIRGVLVCVVLVAAITQSARITEVAESTLYGDEVVFAEQTAYQRVVLARTRDAYVLYLDGSLQFSSNDEYRYHEALVHPAFAVAERHERVLIVGGGDGLAAREVLRYADVASITLVDLDGGMTRIASTFGPLTDLNRGALRDPRVTVVNDDAMQWLQSTREVFDVIVVDFPDPHSLAVGKLYTTRFYAAAKRRLAHNGAMAVQSTSPLYSRASFWCIARTIEASGFHVRPYHAMVPAFGEWGFVLAAHHDFDVPTKLRASELRFLDDASLASLFVLSADMSEVPVEVNRLDNQVLVQLHTRDTRKWE